VRIAPDEPHGACSRIVASKPLDAATRVDGRDQSLT